MSFSKTLVIGALAIMATSANAFVPLPGDGSRLLGSANPGSDQLFLGDGPANPAGDFNNPVTGAPIFGISLPANFVEQARRVTEIELPDDDDPTVMEEVGEFIDAVFLDTTTNTLVFGSRIELEFEESDEAPGTFEWADAEINDIFRSGFNGYAPEVGWTSETSADLRMFTAAASETSGVDVTNGDPETPNPDVVGMQSDINGEEGNPYSGWYLIRTNATAYTLASDAVRVFQAGEEVGDTPFNVIFDGYAPVPVPAAVWLMGSALIGLVGVGRRKKVS